MFGRVGSGDGKALAAVMTQADETQVVEVELPEIPADAGLLQVEAAGVCGSDARFYRTLGVSPRILGHENVGRIARLGTEAARRWGVREGDRVALEEFLPCGACRYCRTGDYRFCAATDVFLPDTVRYGWTPIDHHPGLWGGYAQYLYLPPNAVLHRIPDDLPGPQAALVLPVSNGIQWVQMDGGAGVGSAVVIQGPGVQGLACVVAAREAGASCIIISGLSKDAHRLDVARRLGADYTVDVERGDLTERVREVTDGALADVVVDTTPSTVAPVALAVEITRPRGTVVLAGIKERPVDGLSSDHVCTKGLTIKGMRGHSHAAVERSIGILALRRQPFHELCSHVLRLADVHRAIHLLGADPDAIRITIDPWI